MQINRDALEKGDGVMPRRTVAVVTGDVNASRRLLEKDARRLEYMLRSCFQDVVATLNDVRAAGFTNFRGDAWQFVVGNPVMAVRATLLFRSLLLVHSDREFGRKIQTSASIGFGAIKFLPTETSSAGGGEAYENSGKRLDKLRRRVPGMGVAGLGETDLFLDSLLGVVDALARHWTALQAQAVSLALQGLAQTKIAGMWNPPITQQAVQKHLSAAGWPAIDPALRWAETIVKGCILKNNP